MTLTHLQDRETRIFLHPGKTDSLETAKANDLEPYCYLGYLFEKLPACKCDDEIRLIIPNRIDPDNINKFRGAVD